MIDLSSFTHQEEEPLPKGVLEFSDGELKDFRDFPYVFTYETIDDIYGKEFADKWWNDKVLKLKWIMDF